MRKGLANLLSSAPQSVPGSCDCTEGRPTLRIASPPPEIVKNLDPGTLGLVALAASAQASYAKGCCGSGSGGPKTMRDYADIESDMKLNPVGTLGRWLRCYILGGVVANGIVTFNTQRTFLPYKMIVGSGLATSTIARLQSGVHQYFATTDPIPCSLFNGANYDTPYLKPLVTEVGEKITGIVTGPAANYALLGFDLDDQCMNSRRKGALMPLGFSQSFATATTADIILQTQKSMRLRRLAIDATQSGFAGCVVNSFFVGNEPQFESADGVPIEAFSSIAENMFIDGDILAVGAQARINVTVTANGGGPTVIQGFFEGDTGY